MAASIVAGHFKSPKTRLSSPVDLIHEVLFANDDLITLQKSDPAYRNMSTTIVGLSLAGNRYAVFNAGDSRAYLFAGGRLRQLSDDHTQAREMYRRGLISDPEYAPAPYRNTVTRYLGGSGSACCPAICTGVIPKDRHSFLLCSDGVYKNVPDTALSQVLSSSLSVCEKSGAVLELAVRNGSADDVSAIIIEAYHPRIMTA